MVNCYLKTLKWSYNRIKNRDIFRQSISLTYKGQDTFSSIIGGITTILMFSFLLFYSFILLRMMFNRSDVTWNQNTLREDLSKDTSPIILSSEDPEFYVSWNVYDKLNTFGVNKEKAVAEEYTHYYSYNDNSVESTLTNITDFECNPDTTPDYLVEDVLCPNWKGLSFHGNDANPTKSFLQASYYTCNPHMSNCEDQDMIKYYVDDTIVSITVRNKYIDLNDIDNPVKYFYDGPYIIKYSSDLHQTANFKIRDHEVVLEDSLLPSFTEKGAQHFKSIEDYTLNQYKDSLQIGSINIVFEKDSKVDQHSRRVLGILEVTGILGGIFEIFEIGFGILIGIYSSFMFKKDLYKHISRAEERYAKLKSSINSLERRIENDDNKANNDEKNCAGNANDMDNSYKAQSPLPEESKLEIMQPPEPDPDIAKSISKFEEDRIPKHDESFQRVFQDEEFDGGEPEQNCIIRTKHRGKHDSSLMKHGSKFTTFFTKLNEMEKKLSDFNNSLDCISIVYMLKILRKQVNYLLLKDKDFNEALEDLPYLAVGIPNLEPDSDEHHEKSMDHEEPIKSADKEDVQNLDMSALKSSSKILPMTSFFRVIPDQALENFERHTNLHNLNNPMNPRMARYFPQEEPGLVKKL